MTLTRLSPSLRRLAPGLILVLSLSGCATYPDWLSASGASRERVLEVSETTGTIEGIVLIDVNDAVATILSQGKMQPPFAEVFPNGPDNEYLIQPGDVVEVSVWEAPPAMLFGSVLLSPVTGTTTTQAVTLPEQMVAPDGTINVPFAGRVAVRSRNAQAVESDIARRLQGQANQPQVLVRVIRNNTANVTVVGDFNNSTLMPLTPKGERVLDAVATGGGVQHPVNRMSVQLSRGGKTAAMALDAIIRDPAHNIALKPGDVVTALHQPQSFTVLGATGQNAEIPFEAQGISLAQALARAGGLNDNRADARGVFIFRFEDHRLVMANQPLAQSADGTVPVVYQVNLRDPATLFLAQRFPMQNRDVIYVSNAPAVEFQKFLRLVLSVTMPTLSITNQLQ